MGMKVILKKEQKNRNSLGLLLDLQTDKPVPKAAYFQTSYLVSKFNSLAFPLLATKCLLVKTQSHFWFRHMDFLTPTTFSHATLP